MPVNHGDIQEGGEYDVLCNMSNFPDDSMIWRWTAPHGSHISIDLIEGYIC